MSKKSLRSFHIAGIFIIIFGGVLLRGYYAYCGNTLSILISSVNNSLWENAKPFLIIYLIWSIVTLMVTNPPFKQYVGSIVISLYLCLITAFLLSTLILKITGQNYVWLNIAILIFAASVVQYLSYKLTISYYEIEKIFLPIVFLLVLFFVTLCCFSVFPPNFIIFKDPDTGMSGVISKYIDVGAFYLDNLYGKLT